jgi:hypothetical protein
MLCSIEEKTFGSHNTRLSAITNKGYTTDISSVSNNVATLSNCGKPLKPLIPNQLWKHIDGRDWNSGMVKIQRIIDSTVKKWAIRSQAPEPIHSIVNDKEKVQRLNGSGSVVLNEQPA